MSLFGTLRETDAQLAYEAAQAVVETHRRVAAFLRPGQTLGQIDTFVARTLDDLGCKSCFLHYRAGGKPMFPSHACLSVNDCIVHGTAGYTSRPLQRGDLFKLDIGVRRKGWIGDAAWTYAIGQPSIEAARLMACGKEALRRGIQALQPGKPLVDWARAVQGHAEKECGFFLAEGLTGHGIGTSLHTPPHVANVVPAGPNDWSEAFDLLRPGMILAVEPMINVGTRKTREARGQWPIFTADGSLSVHYEHDVLITADGPRVLSQGLEDIPDVIPAD